MKFFLFIFIVIITSLSARAEDLSKCMAGWKATESGSYSDALVLYDSCIKGGSLSEGYLARTYRNIGITYRRSKQPLNAIEAYNKAIAIKPTDVVDDYINRGNAYDEANEFKMALSDYAKALEIRPGYGEAYYNRGISYEHRGMLDKAKAEFISAYNHGLRSRLLYERYVAYGLTSPK